MTHAELLRAIARAHFCAIQQELERETLTYAPEPEEEEWPDPQ